MHAVEVLQVPLVFGRGHAFVTLTENGAVATLNHDSARLRTAASTVVMRSGCHFAQFTVVSGESMMFGVLRPGWDVEGGADAYTVDDHCFYGTGGRCFPSGHSWEGSHEAREQGDRVGMLLDVDQGSMTVWKNDVKLGVMVAEGLSGPFCWAVDLFRSSSARIESAALPAQ